MKPALFWETDGEEQVRCLLCPHHCRIREGRRGRCLARVCVDGQLWASGYGQITSLALDPVEKKPFCRFYPGRQLLSAGSFGCNLSCGFCQNWQISQRQVKANNLAPAELVDLAVASQAEGCIGLALTYNEPLINPEYLLDCFQLARQAGLKTTLVSNGFIEPAPLNELLPWVDAWNIDLKAWDDRFYRTICGGTGMAVRQTIAAAAAKSHVEVTTLIIPGANDSPDAMREEAAWLASLRPDIPLHLTRHHPDYQMTEGISATRKDLERLAQIAREHLQTVRLGNC